MKFNPHVPEEHRELLEKQYKEYLKTTPMTKKEQRALREWVKDGRSVFENSCGAWADGGVPVEFLTIYRDEEYIRQHTKGMSPEESQKFAIHYYGWDDDNSAVEQDTSLSESTPVNNDDEELPFS